MAGREKMSGNDEKKKAAKGSEKNKSDNRNLIKGERR